MHQPQLLPLSDKVDLMGGPNRMRDMANLEPSKYLRRPKSVVVDDEGRMFISDNGSYRVQVYQKEVGICSTGDDRIASLPEFSG